jgi:hypothetical protein
MSRPDRRPSAWSMSSRRSRHGSLMASDGSAKLTGDLLELSGAVVSDSGSWLCWQHAWDLGQLVEDSGLAGARGLISHRTQLVEVRALTRALVAAGRFEVAVLADSRDAVRIVQSWRHHRSLPRWWPRGLDPKTDRFSEKHEVRQVPREHPMIRLADNLAEMAQTNEPLKRDRVDSWLQGRLTRLGLYRPGRSLVG